MDKERLNKKQIIPLVIGILTMVILVSSATYAYFRVSVGNSATSTTITGDIGGGTLGTVTLSGGGSKLYLGVSAYDMSENKKGTTYYSSTTEGSRETNLASAGKTTYTAELTGDDSGATYACDYEFTVTKSGDTPSNGALSVVFEGDIDKTVNFNTSLTTISVSGSFQNIKSSDSTRTFNAYLKLDNTQYVQNSLAGTNISVQIKNTKWKCYLLEELPGEAYAILTDNGGTYEIYDWETDSTDTYSLYDLTFVRSETPLKSGDSYDGKEIVAVYTGFETSSVVPWEDKKFAITNVAFEDEIRPISTANWFSLLALDKNKYGYFAGDVQIDLTKLNTSLVTDMSNMFAVARPWDDSIIHSVSVEGLNDLDVSNVTNMEGMFYSSWIGSVNLSNWDVSNVTNMSYMFFNEEYIPWPTTSTLGLEEWNVSSVTDMSYMFSTTGWGYTSVNSDLSGWDVSNVTNMEGMFQNARIEANNNLSGWNVSNVENHSEFSEGSHIEGEWDETGALYTFTAPKWPTTS